MEAITEEILLSECAQALGLRDVKEAADLLKPALRRAIFQIAPCSTSDLIRFVIEPLVPFGDLRGGTEQALSEMITYGDILEMRRLDSDPWDAPEYLLRPAPPSFVMRGDDEAIILGISGDLPSALPAELETQVNVEGPVRVLRTDQENLSKQLQLLGLIALPEAAWLRTPPATSAATFLKIWQDQLTNQSPCVGSIEGLEILDSSRSNSFYSGRWSFPEDKHSGFYIGRREQRYGSKLWSVVELDAGTTIKLLDIRGEDDWQRPHDVAWRIQAAIDRIKGVPQKFKIIGADAGWYFDFQAPLPAFAERRLTLVGDKSKVSGALYRFAVPETKKATEVAALQSLLWLEPEEDRGQS